MGPDRHLCCCNQRHTNSNAYPYRDGDTDCYPNCHAYAKCNSDTNAASYADTYSNCDTGSNRAASADSRAQRNASRLATASTVG